MSPKPQPIIKNIKVSQKYGVSRPTVGKWLDNALSGKNNLQVTEKAGRQYIIDNKHNAAEIVRLKDHGIKYRNKIAFEAVEPSRQFYTTFNDNEIIDISSALEFNREIPVKYTYFNGGANLWDNFIKFNEKDNPYYIQRQTELVEANLTYVLHLLKNYSQINIIELGPGNATPTLRILPTFLQSGKKITYTAVDVSQRMIEICRENITASFPDMEFHSLVADFETVSLQNYLFTMNMEKNSCNLIMYLGGNIGVYDNRIEHLKHFQKAMGANDFIMVNNILDEVNHRTSFKSFDNSNFLKQFTWLAREIGLTQDMTTNEFKYVEHNNFRRFNLKLTKDVDINFSIDGRTKVIKIKEGESINVWKHGSWKPRLFFKEFHDAGLLPLQQSINREIDTGLIIGQRSKKNYSEES